MGHKYITLKSTGRKARLDGSQLVAVVGLGFARPGYQGVYRHPEIHFRTLDTDGATNICGPDISMRFQTHAMGSTDNPQYDRQGPRGFLAMGSGEWVGCYGGEIKARFQYSVHGKALARIVALVDRAREVTRHNGDRRYRGCELLRLLVGLRRCGVEIRIYNEQHERRRIAA